MDDPTEHDRIIRIARAMCRARRLDPDLSMNTVITDINVDRPLCNAVIGTDAPTWMLFVGDAKQFVAAHPQQAAHL